MSREEAGGRRSPEEIEKDGARGETPTGIDLGSDRDVPLTSGVSHSLKSNLNSEGVRWRMSVRHPPLPPAPEEERQFEVHEGSFQQEERERANRGLRLRLAAGGLILAGSAIAFQVAQGSGVGQVQPAATPAPAPARDAVADKIVAIFNQGAFTTRYVLTVNNPDRQPLTLRWAGPNCGTWDNQALHTSTEVTFQEAMAWSHPHPPCAAATNHSDVQVTVSIGYQGGTLVCVYKGSESGNGPECKKL